MRLRLVRERSSERSTIGSLFVDDIWECWTLEDVVREGPKVPGKTAIPAGSYRVVINYSPRFKRLLPQILDVPGFVGIRIHPGNTDADTEGCILVGQVRGQDYVGQSRQAFGLLLAKLQTALKIGDVWIDIVNAPRIEAGAPGGSDLSTPQVGPAPTPEVKDEGIPERAL